MHESPTPGPRVKTRRRAIVVASSAAAAALLGGVPAWAYCPPQHTGGGRPGHVSPVADPTASGSGSTSEALPTSGPPETTGTDPSPVTTAPITPPISSAPEPTVSQTSVSQTSAASAPSAAPTSTIDPADAFGATPRYRQITFAGDAGSPPSPADWNYELGGGGWGNGELETYTDQTTNAHLDGNGDLQIVARRAPDGSYTSARLSTAGKVIVAPGSYVEATILAPAGDGVWPAFWTVGTQINSIGWPLAGELDVMEGSGGFARQNVHAGNPSTQNSNVQYGWGTPGATVQPLDGKPHSYGVYFDANEVRMYIDRKLMFVATAQEAAQQGAAWPFGSAQYLVLNVAVTGDTPASTPFPATMTVGPISIWTPSTS
jgi:beta-glucanase (GH16 family)